MKLADALGAYYAHSGKAGDVARQLAFGGLAIVWIFKSGDNGVYSIPHALEWPTLFLVGALASDLLQYVAATLIWGIFHRAKESKLLASSAAPQDEDFTVHPGMNVPAIGFLILKLTLVVAGYTLLIAFLISAIKH